MILEPLFGDKLLIGPGIEFNLKRSVGPNDAREVRSGPSLDEVQERPIDDLLLNEQACPDQNLAAQSE